MIVKYDQIADGIIAYADAEILPKMSGLQLWLAAGTLVTARMRIDTLVPLLASNKVIAALGIVNADGSADIDIVAETAKTITRKYGVLPLDIPAIGEIRLSENDFDMIKDYIIKAGG